MPHSPPGLEDSPATSPRFGRVLVVDDEAPVREILGEMIEALGHPITLAADGAEALAALRGAVHVAVLLDLTMPGLPGEVVEARIREGWSDLPVILMSGYPGLPGGANTRHLRKPFNFRELEAALQAVGARPATGTRR